MDDGPLKDFWVTHKGSKILEGRKDKWAEQAIKYAKDSDYGYIMSGDTMVLAMTNKEDKTIEVYDLIVKRRATIHHE